jgi:hypothetical protein
VLPNVIKMKLTHWNSILLILFVFLISCNNKELNKEIDVINDAFLTVTDTVAYYELSLRPPAPDADRKISANKLLQNKLVVVMPDTLYPFAYSVWLSGFKSFCKGWSRDEDPSIIELKKRMCEKIDEGTTPQKINLNRLKDIGRYILIKNKSELESDMPIVGEVQFSRVVFNKEESMAVFAARISDTEKLIIEKLFILSKVAGKWKVIKVEIFAVS